MAMMKPLFSRALFLCREDNRHLPALFHQVNHFSKFFKSKRDNTLCRVPISVWWNFEDCRVPTGVSGSEFEMRITEVLKGNGINGHIEINAFGDFQKLSSSQKETVTSIGANITHIPRDRRFRASDANEHLLLQAALWANRNPPPAHVFLVTNKRSIGYMLNSLVSKNYNTLLASSKNMPDVVLRGANVVWDWPCFVKGEVHAKHYMRPFTDTWYGHYEI